MTTGDDAAGASSALPAIVREWIPNKWLADRPATFEGLWAAFVAIRNGAVTVLVAAYTFAPAKADDSPTDFLWFIWTHWEGVLMPLVWAWLRAQTAFKKAAQAAPGTPSASIEEPGVSPPSSVSTKGNV